MSALIRFDCFGVIFMTMIFISSQFDPLICRACCFLQMLFLPPVRRCRKVISHSDRYSIFKVQRKGLSLIPTGRGQMHPLNGKIFLNEKTSSLIWTKGAEMHTQFQAFSKKFFEKIYPFTCSHWEAPIYRVFMKNFLSGKIPLTYLELQVSMTPYFTEKMRKYFFGCRCFILLPSKSLFTYSH